MVIILGGHDGYLRAYDDSQKYDEGAGDEQVLIDAYVMFTPMMIGPLNYKGRINRTVIITGGGDTDTDTMDYSIYVGDTAEDVINRINTVEISGTVTGVDRVINRNKAVGQFMSAYISNNNNNESFGFEVFIIEVNAAGRIK